MSGPPGEGADRTALEASPPTETDATRISALYERLIEAEADKSALAKEVHRLSSAAEAMAGLKRRQLAATARAAELEFERTRLDQEIASLKGERAAHSDRIAHLESERTNFLNQIALLEAERSTFGAQLGRWLTRGRNRFAPAGTRRGRLVALSVKGMRTAYKWFRPRA